MYDVIALGELLIDFASRSVDDAGYPNIEIEVDGNVSFENAKRMSAAGADIFVAGSSSVFSKVASLTENMEKLRKIIE